MLDTTRELRPHPEFPLRLFVTRKARGLSQEKLALAIDTDANTIANWEKGRYKPTDELLYRLVQFLGMEHAAYLLEEE